jgi:single-strand DNA-binding protein
MTIKVYYPTKVFRLPHLCIIKFLITQKTKTMSTIKNSVRLIGNIGGEPEIKNFDKNKKLAKLSLATNETYKNEKGEKVTETQWHNLVAWGGTAAIIEKYVKKGQEVAIEGKLTTRTYNDKEGNKRYVTEVLVNEVLLMSKN